MARRTTKLVRERAFETIKVIATAAMNGETAISYSDLAKRLSMPNDTGRGLGPVLDEAGALCKEHGLPDVATLVVTKHSLDTGDPMPSEDSFESDGRWRRSGMDRQGIKAEQDRVRVFDWETVPSLNLG